MKQIDFEAAEALAEGDNYDELVFVSNEPDGDRGQFRDEYRWIVFQVTGDPAYYAFAVYLAETDEFGDADEWDTNKDGNVDVFPVWREARLTYDYYKEESK